MTAGTAALLAGTLSMQATADTSPAAKPGAAPAPQPEPRNCTLHPSAHADEHHEWASCLRVDARLQTMPARGQTARLSVVVLAEHTEKQVRIEADLPSNLSWVQAPAGLSRRQVASAAPETGGRLDRVTATRAMTGGAPQRFEGIVQATESGPAQIRVRALVDLGGGNVDAAEDSVFLTIGQAGKPSVAGIPTGPDGPTAAVAAGTVAAPALSRPAKSVGTSGLATPFSDDQAVTSLSAATACVSGGWFYIDNNGVTRPARNFQVQVWDYDPVVDDLLASGVTDGAGNYHLCFDNDDGLGAATQDPYIKFVSSNSRWRVQNGGSPYVYKTGHHDDVANGSDTNFGSLLPGNTSEMRGLHAFDEVNDAWNWIPGSCWDQKDAACRQVKINWSPSSVDGTFYSTGDKTVHLMAADPDAPITVVHETGHAIMDDVYQDAFPVAPNCDPHVIENSTSAGCAWTEGWAEWFPAMVYNDPFFRWPSGNFRNLETPTWGTVNWATGATSEGRVAGTLIDMSDSANEAYWDRTSEGAPGNIWTTFQKHVSGTLSEFFVHRSQDGFEIADSGARAAAYQNTIDFTFRDPLPDNLALNRPTPTPHNYGFSTTANYWSVVAVRPPVGSTVDYDLDLFDDRPQSTLLASSADGGSRVDFVAVDSNRRALGDYYPRVRQFSGTGNYRVQLAQGGTTLPAATSQALTMGSADVVAVRDSFLTAGSSATFTVSSSGTGDAELFVLGSKSGDSSTWVRGRGSALAGANAAGPGGLEQVTLTAPEDGWYGVVLVNKSGSGTYTLTRS
jgi:hypothetical protein